MPEDVGYWDRVAGTWLESEPSALWRAHSDAVNTTVIATWLANTEIQRLLKTDLFDEAFGEGLYSLLASRAQEFVGIDLSERIIRTARSRHAGLKAIGADTRCLPFADTSYDLVISNSTLDHFRTPGEIVISLQELHRILRPNGRLLLTLDNLANPIIHLRQVLPFNLLHRLGLVPYFVGATFGPRRLRRTLEEVGFEVEQVGAILHCPRVLAVAMSRVLEKYAATATHERFLRGLMTFESMSRWATRFLTGHYVVANAVRR